MDSKEKTVRNSNKTNSRTSSKSSSASGGKRYKAEPKKDSARKTSSAGKKNGSYSKNIPVKNNFGSRAAFSSFVPFIMIICAVLTTVSFIIKDFGIIGNFLRDNILFGFFSVAAYVLPVIFVAAAVLMFLSPKIDRAVSKIVYIAILFILVCALFHLILADSDVMRSVNPVIHYENGIEKNGGGLVGGFVGGLLAMCFSRIGAVVITLAVVIILCFAMTGSTPKDFMEYISERSAARRAARAERESYGEKFVSERDIIEDDEFYGSDSRPSRKKERHGGDEASGSARDVPATLPKNNSRHMPDEADKAFYDERSADRRRDFDPTSTDDDFPIPDVQLEIPNGDDIPDAVMSEDGKPKEKGVITENSSEGDTRQIEPSFDGGAEDLLDSFEDESLFEDPEDEEVIKRLSKYYLENDADVLSVKEKTVSISSGSALRTGDSDLSEGSSVSSGNPVSGRDEKAGGDEYVFPDISLLSEDKKKKNVDYSRELREKETRLIETLEKFNVHTDSAGLPSKGPTITRYELRPAPGTRVRAIVNLVDDIALSLATSGIRIEAPIPGKSAVGIEVPNDVRETVRLRNLIDTDTFRSASSKLSVALGEDVAGAPVYFDIAKMPHLLVAGATGMGKSVCINCLLISLLYKSTPDEVKLILIDPKKVEFSMYSELPHLLVPVVSDPKKAAGALSWAVSEMERRFSLIDEAGVRNIFGYNEVAADDPTKEKLSQIVIIIDELADLMMTAPDSVEDSVCRLAQKARAAGMHLVIGTQRPSVDVITGTIKSNIPSRIAFTVASQIDSRTIIDMSGAEKLIGRGDMLFSPVGATKPIRVQGAFVEDGEVERVVEFIKSNDCGRRNGYSDDVMTKIESEAAKCVSKKRLGGGADDAPQAVSSEEEDPMFWRAVELAVDSGKISTSLIQRKCSLGFGRAAKLIDRMEALGFVSAPDGQKPRQVKITREELDEIRSAGPGDTAETDGE